MCDEGRGGVFTFWTPGRSKFTCFERFEARQIHNEASLIFSSATTGRPSLGQPDRGITVRVPYVSAEQYIRTPSGRS